MSHDVFISYSSKDKPTADAACAVLEANGLRCWMAPRDILPGMDWGEAIVDAIAGARAFLLIFSSCANDSQQIKREVERAVNRGLPVIPLRIENVAPTRSLEYFISTPHWLDAYDPPLQKHLGYLVQVIRTLLAIDPDSPAIKTPPADLAPLLQRPLKLQGWPLFGMAALAAGVAMFAIWALVLRNPAPAVATNPPAATSSPAPVATAAPAPSSGTIAAPSHDAASSGATTSSETSGGRHPPSGNTPSANAGTAQLLQTLSQPEQRDASGRIVTEAALIHVIACYGSGRQLYLYEYLNRPGFRAVQPPDWSHAVGGRDFNTYEQAVLAGCG